MREPGTGAGERLPGTGPCQRLGWEARTAVWRELRPSESRRTAMIHVSPLTGAGPWKMAGSPAISTRLGESLGAVVPARRAGRERATMAMGGLPSMALLSLYSEILPIQRAAGALMPAISARESIMLRRPAVRSRSRGLSSIMRCWARRSFSPWSQRVRKKRRAAAAEDTAMPKTGCLQKGRSGAAGGGGVRAAG